MVRRLRLVIVVALWLPLVLLGNVVLSPAAQADVGGEWSKVNWSLDVNNSPDVECEAYLRVKQTSAGNRALELFAGGRCIGGHDYSVFACQLGEYNCTNAAFSVEGTGCADADAFVVHALEWAGYDNAAHVAFKLPGGSGFIGDSCVPTQACLRLYGDAGFGIDGESETECLQVAFDMPEGTGYSCAYGSVDHVYQTDVNQWALLDADGVSPWDWYHGTSSGIITGSRGVGTWVTYVVYDNTSSSVMISVGTRDYANHVLVNAAAGSGGESSSTTRTFGEWRIRATTTTGISGLPLTHLRNSTSSTVPPSNAAHTRRVVGYGLIRLEDFAGQANSSSPGALWTLPSGTTAQLNSHIGTGVVGLNDPVRCAFYIGEKTWTNANTLVDEPAEAVLAGDPPPTPVDPTPTPDPETCDGLLCLLDVIGWLKAIWSAIVNLGQTIASAIASALGGLAQSILDGIESLFVPDEGAVQDAWDQVNDAWGGAGADEWSDWFDSAVPSASTGGCSGPTVSVPLGSLADETFQPLDACGGWQANAAVLVKIMLTAGVTIAGALSVWRSISAGFGYVDGSGSGAKS